MLALIAIMTVGIELRDANATPTTIAVSDVNMTDASANAILEYDTVAHIFKQAGQLLISRPMRALCTCRLANRSRSPSFLTSLASGLLFEHWYHTKTELQDDRPRQKSDSHQGQACQTQKSTSAVRVRLESASYLSILP